MKFGLFGSAQARRAGPDTDSSQGFRDFIDNNVEAEGLGYYSTFLVEHHFTGFGQVSASLNLLTWLGARTRHLRLGTAVLVLPWHNPVLLAEQAATLDLLSGGRLDFGIGKGYRWNEFAGFCVPMEEADERFEEVLRRGHPRPRLGNTVLASWQIFGRLPPDRRRAADPATAAPAVLDGCRQREFGPPGCGARLQHAARTARARRVTNWNRSPSSGTRSRRAAAGSTRWRSRSPARCISPKTPPTRRPRSNAATRAICASMHWRAGRATKNTQLYILDDEKEARHESAESALFGTPDEIIRKLEILRAGGVEIGNHQFRRLAREHPPLRPRSHACYLRPAGGIALAGK